MCLKLQGAEYTETKHKNSAYSVTLGFCNKVFSGICLLVSVPIFSQLHLFICEEWQVLYGTVFHRFFGLKILGLFNLLMI